MSTMGEFLPIWQPENRGGWPKESPRGGLCVGTAEPDHLSLRPWQSCWDQEVSILNLQSKQRFYFVFFFSNGMPYFTNQFFEKKEKSYYILLLPYGQDFINLIVVLYRTIYIIFILVVQQYYQLYYSILRNLSSYYTT